MNEIINIKDVVVEDRLRKELGDIDGICNSIREFGIIQPMVFVSTANGQLKLVAGGRRFCALERLGVPTLVKGKHFVLRDEISDNDPQTKLRLQAIELEENVRRKDLTWQEVVLGKQRLLETMQKIHGVATEGGRTRTELSTGESQGFSIRKLSAMLGESLSTTARDLSIARAAQVVPQLLLADSKESAFKKAGVMVAIGQMTGPASPNAFSDRWKLYEGDFRTNIHEVKDESVDLVITDLPYGAEVDQMTKYATGTVSFDDSRSLIVGLVNDVAFQTNRILKQDRFAFFFFGFNYYTELVNAMRTNGLKVFDVPFIWVKPGGGTTSDPYHRYANGYEAILVVAKGNPQFIRVGRNNVYTCSIDPQKLHVNQKPVALLRDLMLDTTVDGNLIVDLMCGSGSTGIAALRSQRQVILFEQEPQSCLVTKGRMQQESERTSGSFQVR